MLSKITTLLLGTLLTTISFADILAVDGVQKVEIPVHAKNVKVSQPQFSTSPNKIEVVVSYDVAGKGFHRRTHVNQPIDFDAGFFRSASSMHIEFIPKPDANKDCSANVSSQNLDECENSRLLSAYPGSADGNSEAKENPEECSYNLTTQSWDDCDDSRIWFSRVR